MLNWGHQTRKFKSDWRDVVEKTFIPQIQKYLNEMGQQRMKDMKKQKLIEELNLFSLGDAMEKTKQLINSTSDNSTSGKSKSANKWNPNHCSIVQSKMKRLLLLKSMIWINDNSQDRFRLVRKYKK